MLRGGPSAGFAGATLWGEFSEGAVEAPSDHLWRSRARSSFAFAASSVEGN